MDNLLKKKTYKYVQQQTAFQNLSSYARFKMLYLSNQINFHVTYGNLPLFFLATQVLYGKSLGVFPRCQNLHLFGGQRESQTTL